MNQSTVLAEPETNIALRFKMIARSTSEREALSGTLALHPKVLHNLERKEMIRQVIRRREAILGKQGYLYTVTPVESSGRSPGDTYLVKDINTEGAIDWTSPNNHPMEKETFQQLWEDALTCLSLQDKIYVSDRAIGADLSYALPVRVVTDSALTSLFTLNMFRPNDPGIEKSLQAAKPFIILVLPYHKLESSKYRNRLRKLPNGKTADMAIAMDCDNRLGLVFGSAYGGSVKKLMFTVMNFYLPFLNILPLHCAANEDDDGNVALFLGLSGTGKTSLSADSKRMLLGDDEHGWSEHGIANFENGCYAKLIDLNPEKEPEIFHAVFHKDHFLNHGVIVENAMIFSNGTFDLTDDRLTPNSRASYPLTFLRNVKDTSRGYHPQTIIFLTADANSVLPPISILNKDQAMLWYLMGYTSKLAGTETGVIDPVTVFSRFFGEPFMPLLPTYYTGLLGKKLEKNHTPTFLLNTGWSGGPYGIGKRMDIALTRQLLQAAVSGDLDHVPTVQDELFHLQIPKNCPGVPPEFLQPKNSWADKNEYDKRARQLAEEFSKHFESAYGALDIPKAIREQCPGK